MRLFRRLNRRSKDKWQLTLLAVAFSFAGFAQGQGAGYWHTNGRLILDERNQQVRITGINWYGFETDKAVANGLYAQDYRTVLQTVRTQGFNTVRIPLSSQMIETPGTNLNIAYRSGGVPINADLRGLNSLQVLDRIVAYAGSIGLKIILDHHRSEAGNSAEANGLWYTAAYPESAWIADWVALARRYAGNATVIGFDLHNEPHQVAGRGACWDCGGANDWHRAAERAGNAVLAANPKLLLFVEGTDVYAGDSYWWGGNLEGVAHSPVKLAVAHQLVYSAHDYGPRETAQKWFNPRTTYATLSNVWSRHWEYISERGLAPVWLGEFGTTNDAADVQGDAPGSEGQWFACMIQFLATHPSIHWNYWALNGEDGYGLLDAQYRAPVSGLKAAMLASIRFPLSRTPPSSSWSSGIATDMPEGRPAMPAWIQPTSSGTSLSAALRER